MTISNADLPRLCGHCKRKLSEQIEAMTGSGLLGHFCERHSATFVLDVRDGELYGVACDRPSTRADMQAKMEWIRESIAAVDAVTGSGEVH